MTTFARTSSLLRVSLVPLTVLRPHEEYIEERVRLLLEDLKKKGIQEKPILVDAKTMIILDGHHRVEALKRLGAKRVAAILIDYDSDLVTVGTWRPEYRVTKNLVRKAGLTGELLPPRTSRHQVRVEMPRAETPLDKLMG